jgi:hypothetical protein
MSEGAATRSHSSIDYVLAFGARRRMCGVMSIKRLCAQEGKLACDVLAWASTNGHQILRARCGTSFRFYIVPIAAGPEHRLRGQEDVVH